MSELERKQDGAVKVDIRCTALKSGTEGVSIGKFNWSSLVDWRVSQIVVAWKHLQAWALRFELLLARYSRTGREWCVVTFGLYSLPWSRTYSLYAMWPVTGMHIMIVSPSEPTAH